MSKSHRSRKVYKTIKRVFDVVTSRLDIIVCVVIGIEGSDPGPVFYKANHIGINNEPFLMYKF